MSSTLPYGIGGQTGNILATCRPLIVTGNIFYLSSVSGSDTNDGLERNRPFATLAAAYAVTSDWDIIVLLSDHSEVLAADLAMTKSLTIVGEGNSSGSPTATIDAAGFSVISYSGATCSYYLDFRNIKFKGTNKMLYFGATVGATTTPTYRVNGCRFEPVGVAAEGVYAAGTLNLDINDTEIVAGASAKYAVQVIGVLDGYNRIQMDSVIADSGIGTGFSGNAIRLYDGGGTGFFHFALTRMTLLNGADVYSNTGKGYINPEESKSSVVISI